MTYDNIKSHKKQGFNLSLKESFLEIPRRVGGGGGGWAKLTPKPF